MPPDEDYDDDDDEDEGMPKTEIKTTLDDDAKAYVNNYLAIVNVVIDE